MVHVGRLVVALVAAIGLLGAGCSSAPARPDSLAKESGPDVQAQWVGRPPERLHPDALQRVQETLHQRGFLSDVPLPGETRLGLIAFQNEQGLAPTGWVDADTVLALGLDVQRILPIVAGAGVNEYRGNVRFESQVGGEPGPATMPPSATAIGSAIPTATEDPVFHYDEARRLRAAAETLRGAAARVQGKKASHLQEQSDKALYLARVHAGQLRDLGGAEALASLSGDLEASGALVTTEPGVGTAAPGEAGEARAAYPAPGEVELNEADVERMQRILYTEGFLHRAPSGEVDNPTRQAVRAWQTARGWEPTGTLDQRTTEGLLGQGEADRPQGLEPPASSGYGE